MTIDKACTPAAKEDAQVDAELYAKERRLLLLSTCSSSPNQRVRQHNVKLKGKNAVKPHGAADGNQMIGILSGEVVEIGAG